MSNYQETTTTGDIKKWRRAQQISFVNPHEQAPFATFSETEITVLPDNSVVERPVRSLTYCLTDPAVMIPLVDPDTYAVTETTFPVGQLALLVTSAYLWLARQQDALEE